MIKIVDICEAGTEFECTFTPEVRTYNITSGKMTDDCIPFRIAQSGFPKLLVGSCN